MSENTKFKLEKHQAMKRRKRGIRCLLAMETKHKHDSRRFWGRFFPPHPRRFCLLSRTRARTLTRARAWLAVHAHTSSSRGHAWFCSMHGAPLFASILQTPAAAGGAGGGHAGRGAPRPGWRTPGGPVERNRASRRTPSRRQSLLRREDFVVMTAGAVSAPLIIPMVQLQTHGAKNHIDTNTPVSIQSDTPEVLIFYTLDGSKPSFGPRESKGSRRYGHPILLPAGRVAVRAVAVTRDGRDSSTVTKVFSVELVESNEDQRQSEGTMLDSSGPSLKPSGPGFLMSRLGSPTTPQPAGSSQRSQSAVSRQQTAFLRCAQCQSPRPSDPFCGFCAQCGSTLPALDEQRQLPAKGGQVLRCVLCNSLVPVNTRTCLICEAAVHQQQPPQSSLELQHSAPPSVDCRTWSCFRCSRCNRADARFCDWCGTKSGHAAGCVVCWRCGANGHLYAFYCTTCGAVLEAPPPLPSSSDITRPVGAAAPLQVSAPLRATPSSGPPPTTEGTTPSKEQSTQTVGLYYPSATALQRETQRKLHLSKQHSTRDQQPLLTSISPGRGFWRKQLDHLCAHLRSYAQNNAPFRTLLGEPRLGQMVSAAIHEDRHEVSLTFSFVSAGGGLQVEQDGDGLGPAAGTDILGGVPERSVDRQRFTWSEDKANDANDANGPHRPTMKPRPPGSDVQLLKELGPGPGRGRISIVQQLLDQGADPSCCDANGRHALAVAVVNGHHDVLPVLVQRGADVDQQSRGMKNTALHEAAALGSEGLKAAEVLLSCRASLRRRNVGGGTPLDVALTSGCSEAAALLAARTGLDMLGKLGRRREDLDERGTVHT